MTKCDFQKLLLQAVDEGLSSIGESPKKAIYFHLEKTFKIRKHDIPRNIEVFAEAIERIFGMGADYLEILIMKRLHDKVKEDFDLDNASELRFIEYVDAVQRILIKKSKSSMEDVSE
ncbi:MAG: hypothetical protein NWE78_06010 [Candidatus Bathyarchaeota archaeon]|nr:hypothetical protein [Candidatus Bathyarchaeota archaeon]